MKLKKCSPWILSTLFFTMHAQSSVIKLKATENLENELKDAVAHAQPGDVVELPSGTFTFQDEITINQAGLTLRGQGMDQTILDFKDQVGGAQGILGMSSGLTFEGFTLNDTPGDALKVVGANGVTFRKVKINWTGGPSKNNGSYGFYPVLSQNVLIEDCEVSGASDAGVYVGQSSKIIVRNVYAHGNVAGIEIENSKFADVTQNTVTDNTGGILIFDLPDLPTQGGQNTRVFKNTVYKNNHKNFSAKGNILNLIPPGVGVLVLANDNTEVFSNSINHHRLSAIIVSHFAITERPITDPNYDPKPERIYLHDNVIDDFPVSILDGTRFNFLINLLFTFHPPAIIVDGIEDGTYSGQPPSEDKKICIQNNFSSGGRPSTFGNMHLDHQRKFFPFPGGPVSRNFSPHDCSFPPLPAVTLDAPIPLPLPKPVPTADEVKRLCEAEGKGVNWEALAKVDCPKLSNYRLFMDGKDPTRNPAPTGIAYDLSTPLFTDYATKNRFVFIPAGKAAQFTENGPLNFPVGTVIAKTFSFPENLIETRLLIHRQSGWVALPYHWNTSQGDAALELGGSIQPVSWTDETGVAHSTQYQIPGQIKCAICHGGQDNLAPIGPKARYLNHGNQLQQWISAGILTGAPGDLGTIRSVPEWNNPSSGSLEARARGYLEINCAHCHNPGGWARNTGLFLNLENAADTTSSGICKPPVAAGAGTGGRLYDIVPGLPENSILTYRMHSAALSARMPQLGRSIEHMEGTELIEEWIQSMPVKNCNEPGQR